MKTPNPKYLLLLAILTAVGFSAPAQDNQAGQRFEEKYQAWKTWTTNHWFMSTYDANREYQEIVALGLPALPYLFKKIENNPEDFHLEYAVELISKRKFDKSEWPPDKLDRLGDSITKSKMYVQWWKVGRHKTGERFGELHENIKALKAQKKDIEAAAIRVKILNLGIAVLPAMMVRVEKGDADVIPLISELTDGAVKADLKPAECLDWWAKNKQIWLLPTNNENP